MTRRPDNESPVFIVGSARSGNTLLYHILLSTGEYAVYRGEPAVFDLVAPRYGDLRHASSRRRLAREWPRSHLARCCGLDNDAACQTLLGTVGSNGDFLVAVMSMLARRQGVPRWAVWGPDNLLLMPWIKREIPSARFIHVVRDGRDVALSLATERWIRPFPWDRDRTVEVAALHWAWKLEFGRRDGLRLGRDYLEVQFERLVTARDEALAEIGRFVGHDIDVDRVEREAVGTLRAPNSTFREEASPPVGRWRDRLTPDDVQAVEGAVGETLVRFGYTLHSHQERRRASVASRVYPLWFAGKHLTRTHTALGRLVDPSRLRLAPPQSDVPHANVPRADADPRQTT